MMCDVGVVRVNPPTDLTRSMPLCALLVPLLSIVREMCPAFFSLHCLYIQLRLILWGFFFFFFFFWCLMRVSQILSVTLTFSIFLSIARWLVSSFSTTAFMRGNVWHPYVIVGKTHFFVLD